ncbi:MAG TPA: hypothetical protein VF092_14855 [Longimicrobium sp.]
MGDLKKTTQMPGGATTGMTPEGDEGEHNRGSEFGAREPGTAGTDRDLDRSGTSINQGHGHPREERGASHD